MNSIHMICHNASGMKSKIGRINEYLGTTVFDLLLIQETWFDTSVETLELTRDTNFTAVRMHRSCTKNTRIRGGGTIIIIRNSLKFHDLTPKSMTLERMNNKWPTSSLIIAGYFNASSIQWSVGLDWNLSVRCFPLIMMRSCAINE